MSDRKFTPKRMTDAPEEENAVAMCHNMKHYGYLTAEMLKDHGCIVKHCPLMKRVENRHFWYSRDIRKCIRETRKTGSGFIYINGRKIDTAHADIPALARFCKEEYKRNGTEPVITAQARQKQD